MKIMLSAGEVSGDMHGAMLAQSINQLRPGTELIGFGGARMEREGVRLCRNFADFNVMGVWEVIKNLGRIRQLLADLTEFMRREKPDLLVLIDYPDFNWRLAKQARRLGIPVFSYIPPSAWAWRKGRAADCAKIAEEFVVIFPHEMEPYRNAGAHVAFVGNPLVDTVKPELTPGEARKWFDVREDETLVLLLPGSRRQEIELLLPAMLGAAKLLKQERPDIRFFLPVADGVDEARIRELVNASGVTVTLTHENRYALMHIADVALATSGTVVMEAALLALPCVVLYRLSTLSYMVGRVLVHIDRFSLPNILVGETFEPELLQDEVEPHRIAREALLMCRGGRRRQEVMEKLDTACRYLGPPGAADRIAGRILAAAEHHAGKQIQAGERYEKL